VWAVILAVDQVLLNSYVTSGFLVDAKGAWL
jgi:hypothetical protein